MLLPNLFIPGFPKAGTTTLSSLLGEHPDIVCASVKEPNFIFTEEELKERRFMTHFNYFRNGLSGYGHFFRHSTANKAKYLVDGSTNYLFNKTFLDALKSYPVKYKLLICLREPAGRVFSHYSFLNQFRKPSSCSTFMKALKERDPEFSKIIFQSHYHLHLRPYLEAVPRENMFFVVFEQFILEPEKVLTDLATFLNVDPTFFKSLNDTRLNETYQARIWSIDRAVNGLIRRGKTLPNLGISADEYVKLRANYHDVPYSDSSVYRNQLLMAVSRAISNRDLSKSLYRLYCRLNRRRVRKTAEDLIAIDYLKREFVEANRLLEEACSLDLSLWR